MTDTAVVPFRVEVPQAEVDDLHDRLARTRWAPEQDLDGDRGVETDLVRRLASGGAGGGTGGSTRPRSTASTR